MVYDNGVIVVVKCGGKILREDKDQVFVPYGSEYSLLIKNLNSRRASVKVSIDGDDVLNGHALIVDANSEVELERFVDKLDKGNKFKFIQKTEKIVDHRGDKVDDGIVRVEYRLEREKQNPRITYDGFNGLYGSYLVGHSSGDPIPPSTIIRSNVHGIGGQSIGSGMFSTSNASVCSMSCSADNISNTIAQDEGITVKGSESSQSFCYGSIGPLEVNSRVVLVRLKGYRGEKEVTKPITVDTKFKCSTCGTVNKSNSKYCRECGTFLE